jgi:fructose-specific component phosphotransferase system IIB-like protein
MFDYLQKFNSLPKNLRDQVSSPSAMAVLTELENKYKLDLAMVVMKVMIKNISINGLATYFISEGGLTREAAENLTRELKEKIFIGVADYLGIMSDIRALDLEKDIKLIISEAGLTLASSELISRFKSILATYLKGVRAKIDTRAVLGKEVISGGLNLSAAEIDRVFKVCDNQRFKSLNISVNSSPINSTLSNKPVSVPSVSNVFKAPENKLAAAVKYADYNLKDALARGEIKKPAVLGLPKEEHQLDLPREEEQLDLPAAVSTLKTPIAPISPISPISPLSPLSPLSPKAPFTPTASINSKVISSPAINIPKVPIIPLPPVPPIAPLAPIIPKVASKIFTPLASIVSKTAPLAPLAPAAPLAPKSAPISIPVKPVVKKIEPIAAPRPVQARQNLDLNPKRPVMHDIKPMPKVMGPIEELQFLDVVNFRRLGTTPSESVIKIYNKIKQLEKEGYEKMIAGIKAWRQSPVNRLYVKIGQEAIAKGLTIKDAALEYQKNNPEYLKIEEIEAIVSLNGKLVF